MKLFAAALIIFGILTAAIPQFNNCTAEGKSLTIASSATPMAGMAAQPAQPAKTVPMKCYWTAQASYVAGIPLLAIGAVLAISKRKETRRGLGLISGILGGFTMLLPTSLIGVCSTMTASCNEVMRPSLLLLGGLVIATSVGIVLTAQRGHEPEL